MINNKIKTIVIDIMMIVLYIVIPMFIYAFFRHLVVKGYVTQDYGTTLINFLGSIIGGTITLIGVVITINYQEKLTQKENSIKYKPILEFAGFNYNYPCKVREIGFSLQYPGSINKVNEDSDAEKFYNQLKNEDTVFNIAIKNNGRGETYSTVLDSYRIKDVNWDSEPNIYANISPKQYIGEITSNEMFGINIILPSHLFIKEKLENSSRYLIRTEIIINYSDMFNRQKYQYTLNINFEVIVKDYEETMYPYKPGFRYAKVAYNIFEIMPQKNIYSEKDKKYVHE